MAEHRVPMLSPALHRQPDPEHSQDPRIRALVSRLRTIEMPGPRPEFRHELRTQLVAITPRIVAEEDLRPVVVKRRPSPVPAAVAPVAKRRRIKIGKPLAILTCVVAIFAVLLGGAVWISKRALPGDTLYDLKRASERVQEAMTTGDTAHAKLVLDFAGNRYGEVSDLLPRSGGTTTVSSHTGSLVSDTLDDADDDVREAMQTLGAQAIRNSSGSGLGLVTGWAGGPIKQLRAIVARIPDGSLHQRGAESLTLLTKANHRAAQLKALGDCACLSHASTDSLGAKPCTKCTSAAAPAVPAPATRGHSGNGRSAQQPAGATSNASSAPSSQPQQSVSSSGGAGGNGSASDPGGTSPGGSGSSSAPLVPGLPGVPGLPSLLPSVSGSACTGLDLGLLNIGRCGIDLGK